MVADVVLHEGGDRVVRVVVALAAVEGKRLTGLGAGLFQGFGKELLLEELVGEALVHQNLASVGEGVLAHELTS